MLIDSFISISYAKSLNHKIEPLEGGMMISTSSSEILLVESVCKNCELRIENVTIRIDLILFEHDELNVIFGNGFLHQISCSVRLVQQGGSIERTREA